MWSMYTLESHSVTKKHKIMSFAGKWLELETIIAC